MIVDRYGEALVRTQLLQQDIVEAIESSCWHVVRLREKGGKWREREKKRWERKGGRERSDYYQSIKYGGAM